MAHELHILRTMTWLSTIVLLLIPLVLAPCQPRILMSYQYPCATQVSQGFADEHHAEQPISTPAKSPSDACVSHAAPFLLATKQFELILVADQLHWMPDPMHYRSPSLALIVPPPKFI
ncbi:hypothetical protein [Herpetosiphon sp. NSE202]|uniref:hypothetical protein n=1 Tax=Herpetosiphon sp. NSE202 TaxID=3351349 RepID=UPI003635B5F1